MKERRYPGACASTEETTSNSPGRCGIRLRPPRVEKLAPVLENGALYRAPSSTPLEDHRVVATLVDERTEVGAQSVDALQHVRDLGVC